MNPKMSIKNNEGIFEDLQLTGKSIIQQMPLETCWNLPEEIGRGTFQKTMLRAGFELYITDFKLREPLIKKRESNASVIGLNFAFSGSIRNKIQYSSDGWLRNSP